MYQHTPALPPAPYHKPKYEPVVYEEEYPKQNCSVVDETIKVTYLMLLYLEEKEVEAAHIKCASRESAGLPAPIAGEFVGLPSDFLPAYLIAAASDMICWVVTSLV